MNSLEFLMIFNFIFWVGFAIVRCILGHYKRTFPFGEFLLAISGPFGILCIFLIAMVVLALLVEKFGRYIGYGEDAP